MNIASPHSIKCFCRNDLKAAYSGQLQAVTGIPLLYTSLYIAKIILHKKHIDNLSLPFQIQSDAKPCLPESINLASYPSEFPSVFVLSEFASYMCFLKFSSWMPFVPTHFPSWYVSGYQKASILISCLDTSNVFSVKVAEMHQEEVSMK